MNNNNLENSIAIIGIACRFPGADNVDELWENLANGVGSIRDLSDEELRDAGVSEAVINHPEYIKRHGGPENIDMFDANFFGIGPDEARYMDAQHRIMLECAYEALEDANINISNTKERIGVFGGIAMPHYMMENLRHEIPDVMNLTNPQFATNMNIGLGNDRSYASSRVSNKLNLQGPAINVDAACATTMFSIHLACKSLLDFESDVVVAGGARIQFPYAVGFLHEEGGMSSSKGDIFSFDQRANGTMFTNGAACIILKRAEDAIEDGDHITALIRGSAINNDGNDKVGFTAPSLNGQRKVIFEAHTVAEVDAAEISYIEAHGTGTSLGDPLEFGALKSIFGVSVSSEPAEQKPFCHIGTLKPNLGHMEAVSGVAGVIKAALMLEKKQLLPNRNFDTPNPEIDFANSPFQVSTAYQPWDTELLPRKAGVSSFGVGGNNAHVILEEYVPEGVPVTGAVETQDEIIVLSAKTAASLSKMGENLAAYLQQQTDQSTVISLQDVAYTSQVCRQSFNKRTAVVASSLDEAAELLKSGHQNESGEASKRSGKISFMFPGQGSQHVGMVADLYQAEPEFKALIDECALLLMPHLHATDSGQGVNDIRTVMFTEAGSELINQTQYSQPALFVAEYALAKWWIRHGVEPQAMIGHSIGEYVAACLAEVFTLEDALAVVAARGRLMQSMPPGDMLSVNLSKEDVLKRLPDDCDLAAHNAPHLTVVSGSTDSIERFAKKLEAEGARTTRLQTSHAFHSRMMEPILAEFKAIIQKAQPQAPTLPFISNVTANWITKEQAISADYWASHLRGTVNFANGLAYLLEEKNSLLLEVGPGTTLAQLAKKQESLSPKEVFSSQGHPKASDNHRYLFRKALAGLWCKGANIHWDVLYASSPAAPRKVKLPTYAFDKNRYVIERKPRDEIEVSVSGERQAFEHWFSAPSWQRDMGKTLSSKLLAQAKNETWIVWANTSAVCQQWLQQAKATGVSLLTIYLDEDLKAGVTDGNPDLLQITPNQQDCFVLPSPEFPDFDALMVRLKEIQFTDSPAQDTETNSHSAVRSVSFWATSAQHADAESVLNQEDISRALETCFYRQMNIVKALDMLEHHVHLTLVSNDTAAVTGSEMLNPAKTAIYGILRVAPLEFERLHCQHVSIELDSRAQANHSRTVTMLLAEVLQPEANRGNSAIRGNYCWRESYEALEIDSALPAKEPETDVASVDADLSLDQIAIKPNGTYLITGGLGGIGLLFAHWLLEQAQTEADKPAPGINLVLVGRSAIPPADEWDAILESAEQDQASVDANTIDKIKQLNLLKQKGATIRCAALDVTNATSVADLVQRTVDEFGAINGIMHSAGVAGDGIISLKTKHQADAVIYPKVLGAYNLHKALTAAIAGNSDLALDFMLLNSSLYAVVGGAGQVDYCAANNMLDAFAHQFSSPHIPIVSINWGPWENLGMTNTDKSKAKASDAGNTALRNQQAQSENASNIMPAAEEFEGNVVEHLLSHPLLKSYQDLGDQCYHFTAVLNAQQHWILDEHRINGKPVVPGTALIDMLLSIGDVIKDQQTKDQQRKENADTHAGTNSAKAPYTVLSNILFLRPVDVSEKHGRVLSLMVEHRQGSYSVAVESTEDNVSNTYAMAEIRFSDEPAPAAIDIDETRFAHQETIVDYDGNEADAVASQNGFIRFGRRWESIKEIRYANNAAFNHFSLDKAFAADLPRDRVNWLVHPALLDLATGIANGLWLQYPESTRNLNANYLPSGYDDIFFYQPLPPAFYAESKLASVSEQGAISFDIHLVNTEGQSLMLVKGFRINPVEEKKRSRKGKTAQNMSSPETFERALSATVSAADNFTPQELQSKAILPAEGLQAFAQLLGMTHMNNVVVCNRSLDFMLKADEQNDEAEDATLLERPDIDTEFAAPQTDTQKVIAEIWIDTLGVKKIGINDNFYDVGGDSLVATKLVATIRRHFDVVVSLDVLLSNATIASLAEYIDALMIASSQSNDLAVKQVLDDEAANQQSEAMEEGFL